MTIVGFHPVISHVWSSLCLHGSLVHVFPKALIGCNSHGNATEMAANVQKMLIKFETLLHGLRPRFSTQSTSSRNDGNHVNMFSPCLLVVAETLVTLQWQTNRVFGSLETRPVYIALGACVAAAEVTVTLHVLRRGFPYDSSPLCCFGRA